MNAEGGKLTVITNEPRKAEERKLTRGWSGHLPPLPLENSNFFNLHSKITPRHTQISFGPPPPTPPEKKSGSALEV